MSPTPAPQKQPNAGIRLICRKIGHNPKSIVLFPLFFPFFLLCYTYNIHILTCHLHIAYAYDIHNITTKNPLYQNTSWDMSKKTPFLK